MFTYQVPKAGDATAYGGSGKKRQKEKKKSIMAREAGIF